MNEIADEVAPNVIWAPLPGSQVLALSCPADEVFFEGTRGPGKTDTQLMRFRMRVGLGYGRFWRGIIFDREYKNLDDIVSKAQRWFNQFDDGARFAGSGASFGWTWPTGEQLLFRHIKKAKDYWLYHGHEYPYIGWNELTKYPTRELYDLMMSTNRSSFTPEKYPVVISHAQALAFGCTLVKDIDDEMGEYLLPPIPLEVFSTLNPYGPGHNWVKHDIIDAAPPGAIVRSVVNVFNPRTQQREDITRTQCRIFGSYKENQFLDPKYIAELESIKDENRRRAWLYGDWDIVSGGALSDVWNSDKCVVDRFVIPDNWYCDRSFDWGSTHPYWCGWWAESNGEEVKMPDGTTRSFPRGSLILMDELYGTKRVGTNSGLRQSPRTVAELIYDQEKEFRKQWCKSKIYAGPADNQIFDVRETDDNDDPETIASKMEEEGVSWEHSDKSKGSRKNGLELLRDRLLAANEGEGPGIYFMRHCKGAIETLPTLPRDEDNIDDVDTDAEDHPYDGIRYRCLKGSNKRPTESVKVRLPT
jgi:hypothetical protein